VLPLPSRTGADGPPRPYGVQPPPGHEPARTSRVLQRAQDRALLYGPFPDQGLARGVSDGGLLASENAAVRALAMRRIRALGGSVARIAVNWREIAPAPAPAAFQARDPASPAYRFAKLDASVRSAVAAGLQPLLVVYDAPTFAEAPHRWRYAYPGTWAPSGLALGEFAAALASRYDGAFPDPQRPGVALPRVRLLQAWNEPNLARYLEPQWVAAGRRWSAFSPPLYRQLLNGFYAGVKSVQPSDRVIAAGIAPEGEPAGVGAMAPVSFLEALLCLNGRERSACPQRSRFDVLAFHPLSVYDPDTPASSALDAGISDIAKVTALLARAERLRTVLPAVRHPLWVTELNWESAPPAAHGVPFALQAAWVARALHRLWVAGVSLVDWQFLVDPYGGAELPLPSGGVERYPRPDGLYAPGPGGDTFRARPRPFLRGFTLPVDPLRVNRSTVRVWALLMVPRQVVVLQREVRPGRWRKLARMRADRYGVLNKLLHCSGSLRLRLGTWRPWIPEGRAEPLFSAVAIVSARASFLE